MLDLRLHRLWVVVCLSVVSLSFISLSPCRFILLTAVVSLDLGNKDGRGRMIAGCYDSFKEDMSAVAPRNTASVIQLRYS